MKRFWHIWHKHACKHHTRLLLLYILMLRCFEHNVRKVKIVVLMACMGLMLVGCENSLESIKDRRVIHIGIASELPPFSYVDSTSESGFSGIEVIIGKRIAKDLLGDEKRVKFVAKPPEVLVELVASGQIDMALAYIPPALVSAHNITQALPYAHTRISIASSVDKPSGIQALFSSTLLVRADSMAELYFTQNYPQIHLERCDSLAMCLRMLNENSQNYFADVDMIITALTRDRTDIVIHTQALGDPIPIVPLVKSSNTSLLAWLNKEINIVEKEGFVTQTLTNAMLDSTTLESKLTHNRDPSTKSATQNPLESTLLDSISLDSISLESHHTTSEQTIK